MAVVLDVVARINQYRVARGLSPLVLNETLMAMAQDQAAYVAALDPMPEGGDMLTVMMSDGQQAVARIVELKADVVILPDTLADVSVAEETPPLAATDEEAPAGETDEADEPLAEDDAAQEATPDEDAGAGEATATPEAPSPEVLIEYDAESLDLVNVADEAINVFDLVLVSGETRFAVTRWAQYVNVPLNRLPAGVCLQVWSWHVEGVLPVPPSCQARASYLTLAPDALFWQAGFSVELNGETLAECPAGGGECQVTLPE
jgi:hypothetical protein